MKKIISLILLVSFVLAMTSCAAPEEIVPEYISMGNKLDFGGTEFTFLSETETGFISVKEGTLLYDCVMERIDEVEENLNCIINIKRAASEGGHYETCRAQISSGICPADITEFRSSNFAALLAYGGYLFPLSDVNDIINYEDTFKYGSPSVLEGAMYNGIPYAVQPSSWPGFADAACFLLAYNRDKINSEGLSDPHEFYENKTWTWDTFETVLETYTSNDASDPYVTLSGHPRAFSQIAMVSNGVKFSDYINGELKTDIYEPRTTTAITWMQDVYNRYRQSIIDVDYWSVKEFVDGQSLFTFASGAQAFDSEILYDCYFVFGLMPFPMGPDAVYGEWANWREGLVAVCMPINTPEPTACAHIISEMFEPLEEFGTTIDDLKEYYTDNVFSSATDTEIFFEVGKYGRYVYWQVGGLEFAIAIAEDYRSKTAKQLIDAYAPTMETLIDKYIEPNFENYMYEHLYAE
ncbi:MAG: extracellular solute-binding protein [Clostridia bacterium]|nr:extracellular solute-binding protein [Clostridia bacterium]